MGSRAPTALSVGTSSEAKLPADLDARSAEVRHRRFKCAEYNLDHGADAVRVLDRVRLLRTTDAEVATVGACLYRHDLAAEPNPCGLAHPCHDWGGLAAPPPVEVGPSPDIVARVGRTKKNHAAPVHPVLCVASGTTRIPRHSMQRHGATARAAGARSPTETRERSTPS